MKRLLMQKIKKRKKINEKQTKNRTIAEIKFKVYIAKIFPEMEREREEECSIYSFKWNLMKR